MITFRTAGKISDKDLDINAIKVVRFILEGYLWDEGEPKKHLKKKKTQIKPQCHCLIYFV